MSNCNCDLGKMCETCEAKPMAQHAAEAFGIKYTPSLTLDQVKATIGNCCDDESNQYDDDSEDHICSSCKEHCCEVKCRVCDETVFTSNCCG